MKKQDWAVGERVESVKLDEIWVFVYAVRCSGRCAQTIYVDFGGARASVILETMDPNSLSSLEDAHELCGRTVNGRWKWERSRRAKVVVQPRAKGQPKAK